MKGKFDFKTWIRDTCELNITVEDVGSASCDKKVFCINISIREQ